MLLDSIGFETIREVYFPQAELFFKGGFQELYTTPLTIFYPSQAKQLITMAKVIQRMCTMVTDEPGEPEGRGVIDYGLHVITIDEEKNEVRLILRNWQPPMIQAFKGVVESLAPLYRWKVVHEEVVVLNDTL